MNRKSKSLRNGFLLVIFKLKPMFLYWLALGLFFTAYTATAQVTNLVSNPSFEQADNSGLAVSWQIYGQSYSRVNTPAVWDQNWMIQLTSGAGAVQRVVLNQSQWKPVRVSARLKGNSIADDPTDNIGASLDFKIAYHDGTFAWAPLTIKTKSVGTFDWKWVGYNTMSLKNYTQPIDWIEVRLRMGNIAGTAWFDDVHVDEWQPAQNGMVTFVFDDSFLSTYSKGYPLLKSFGYVASEAAVTSYLDSDAIHMTLAQLKDLYANGWSVVCHTVTHPDLTMLSLNSLNDELYFSHKYLVDNGFLVRHFVLPFGAYNALVISRAQAERYSGLNFMSVRSSDQGLNPQGVFPYNIAIQKIISTTNVADVMNWLAQAKTQRAWLILQIHEIDNANGIYTVSYQTLQSIVQAVANSGLSVVTYDDGFNQIVSQIMFAR